jgi:16S rRNA processing protein RimM
MGRVVAPYGVRGWIKVEPYTVLAAALLDYDRWWLASGEGRWSEFAVLSSRPHSNALLAELSGLASREAVQSWRGALVGVPRDALPKPDENEVYWADLSGLKVINRTGEVLGRVVDLLETGAHPVLRVLRDSGDEQLIPLVAAFVDAIELDKGRIVIDWQADY